MQGTWKETVSGWKKDSRRKKQSRKHTLKDKVKPLIKKFHYKDIDNETFYNEASKIIYNKPENILKYSAWVDIYEVTFLKHNYFKETTIYCYNGVWYNFNTNEKMFSVLYEPHFYKQKKIGFHEIKFDEPLIIKQYGYKSGVKDEIFIYGKPLCEDWHNEYGFWGRKSRKWYQTKANRKDRRLAKKYCNFGDFEGSVVKTHCSSKSIAHDVW